MAGFLLLYLIIIKAITENLHRGETKSDFFSLICLIITNKSKN